MPTPASRGRLVRCFRFFPTAKSGSSKGSVMNIALKPEPTADKSRDIHRKTSSQFEAVALIPRPHKPRASLRKRAKLDARGL